MRSQAREDWMLRINSIYFAGLAPETVAFELKGGKTGFRYSRRPPSRTSGNWIHDSRRFISDRQSRWNSILDLVIEYFWTSSSNRNLACSKTPTQKGGGAGGKQHLVNEKAEKWTRNAIQKVLLPGVLRKSTSYHGRDGGMKSFFLLQLGKRLYNRLFCWIRLLTLPRLPFLPRPTHTSTATANRIVRRIAGGVKAVKVW